MSSALKFSVRRQEPTLVPPAQSTPHEFKPLSDIDDQESLRHQTPIVQFYVRNPSMDGRDPASVVKQAIARLLVFYYPFAGRIREGPNGKLIVETTGEGVMFIEAEADISLQEFGDWQPPCPCIEELLYDVPGSAAVVGGPLLLIQVTRLTCGGFVFGVRMNHAMCDGAGIGQFMVALGEVARGLHVPSVVPVWKRELLNARDPPRPTFSHLEYDEGTTSVQLDDKVERCFFFGEKEIQALRQKLPESLRGCKQYDLLAATLWRARTSALRIPDDEEVKLLCVVNARTRYSPPLPVGYYGNAIGLPTVVTTAGELLRAELRDVVEMVREATEKVTDEYMRSTVDTIVAKGRPCASVVGTYHISDLTGHGFGNVDFGWGPAVYGGIARVGTNPGVASFYISYRTSKGEDGVLVPAALPALAMERFLGELRAVTNGSQ
ncbi:benzyl alcohol O-benzoyltransferase-like [Aristolochia californica]|uniref:benzyl alcohol O-benzoyltransferase-like n=1 Tax=Aristolochia californica TaxID=171875 RepID=UPI0035DD9A95